MGFGVLPFNTFAVSYSVLLFKIFTQSRHSDSTSFHSTSRLHIINFVLSVHNKTLDNLAGFLLALTCKWFFFLPKKGVDSWYHFSQEHTIVHCTHGWEGPRGSWAFEGFQKPYLHGKSRILQILPFVASCLPVLSLLLCLVPKLLVLKIKRSIKVKGIYADDLPSLPALNYSGGTKTACSMINLRY